MKLAKVAEILEIICIYAMFLRVGIMKPTEADLL